jgi:hypothetical protein
MLSYLMKVRLAKVSSFGRVWPGRKAKFPSEANRAPALDAGGFAGVLPVRKSIIAQL